MTGAAFSPDGDLVITSSRDGTARLWNAFTGELSFVLSGHKDDVTRATFSPDGNRIATSSRDGTVRVWVITQRTVKVISELRLHAAGVSSVAFSPDGRRIVTVGSDGSAQISSYETYISAEDLVKDARRRVTRPLSAEEREKYLPPPEASGERR